MALSEKLISADAFLQITQSEENQSRRLELIEGVIVELPVASQQHTVVTMRIGRYLSTFVDQHNFGFVTGPNAGYQLSDNTILQPDVGFISKDRHSELNGILFPIPPDLAVEVISPNDEYSDVAHMRHLYLAHGTRSVWIVEPKYQTVEVHTPNGKTTLEGDAMLDGGDVLPGFTLALRDVFASASNS